MSHTSNLDNLQNVTLNEDSGVEENIDGYKETLNKTKKCKSKLCHKLIYF